MDVAYGAFHTAYDVQVTVDGTLHPGTPPEPFVVDALSIDGEQRQLVPEWAELPSDVAPLGDEYGVEEVVVVVASVVGDGLVEVEERDGGLVPVAGEAGVVEERPMLMGGMKSIRRAGEVVEAAELPPLPPALSPAPSPGAPSRVSSPYAPSVVVPIVTHRT